MHTSGTFRRLLVGRITPLKYATLLPGTEVYICLIRLRLMAHTFTNSFN